MKNAIKNASYFLLNLFCWKKRAVILMYHSISEQDRFFSVKPEVFAKQMKYLHDKKFEVLPISKLFELKVVSKRTIFLTFDDGYLNNYSEAYRVLKKYNFPATIFLATGIIGKESGADRILDWEKICEMNKSGLIDFEPHGVNHKKLTHLDFANIRKEINDSRRELELRLSKKCYYFAYPSGKFNADIIKIIKENGFKAAFTVKKGAIKKDVDLYKINRNAIDSAVNFTQFKGIVKYGRI